jgi:hypothetical protein
MNKIPISEVVLDYSIYPRQNLDSGNIRHLVDALAAGDELPPIIICRKTKRVVDGFHRVKAYQRFYGPECSIPVIQKTYDSEAELFLDAVKYNAAHGTRLGVDDRARCCLLGEQLRVPLDRLAGVLHMPEERLREIREARLASTNTGAPLVLKRTISHMAGRRLTKRQEEVNAKLSGLSATFYLDRVIDLIEARLLRLDDEAIMERLRRLHELLDEVCAER